jgi:hypothetical protein
MCRLASSALSSGPNLHLSPTLVPNLRAGTDHESCMAHRSDNPKVRGQPGGRRRPCRGSESIHGQCCVNYTAAAGRMTRALSRKRRLRTRGTRFRTYSCRAAGDPFPARRLERGRRETTCAAKHFWFAVDYFGYPGQPERDVHCQPPETFPSANPVWRNNVCCGSQVRLGEFADVHQRLGPGRATSTRRAVTTRNRSRVPGKCCGPTGLPVRVSKRSHQPSRCARLMSRTPTAVNTQSPPTGPDDHFARPRDGFILASGSAQSGS